MRTAIATDINSEHLAFETGADLSGVSSRTEGERGRRRARPRSPQSFPPIRPPRQPISRSAAVGAMFPPPATTDVAAAFVPASLERPGGGRITDKTVSRAADLVTVRGVGGKAIQLHGLAARAWEALVVAGRAAGFHAPLFLPTSGFRDPVHQKRLWQAALERYETTAEARKWVAPPGTSAHQTGRAIDLYLGDRNQSENVAKLRTLRTYQWLAQNAQRFGFYPYVREPWHWEYNPPVDSGLARTTILAEARTVLGATSFRSGVLDTLRPLTSRGTSPTEANALAIMKAICHYHDIPWQLGYTLLEHEGGVRLVAHHDGVMQTTASARRTAIPRIPRELGLTLIGASPEDMPTAQLTMTLAAEFPRRLAIQIAAGVQELADGLRRFRGYVALAFVAYNAGAGWAYYTATNAKFKAKPAVTDEAWENMCRYGSSLLHQRSTDVDIEPGMWKCDKNIPAWFREIRVRHRTNRLLLVSYQYLRSVKSCIRALKPTTQCDESTHRQRSDGTGEAVCSLSRSGALDKLYDPSKLGAKYRAAAGGELTSIRDDGQPLRAEGARLVKVTAAPTP